MTPAAQRHASRIVLVGSVVLLLGMLHAIRQPPRDYESTQPVDTGFEELLALPWEPQTELPLWPAAPLDEEGKVAESDDTAPAPAIRRIRILGEVRLLEDALYLFIDQRDGRWFQLSAGESDAASGLTLNHSAESPALLHQPTGRRYPVKQQGRLAAELLIEPEK